MADGPTPDQASPGEILAAIRAVERKLDHLKAVLTAVAARTLTDEQVAEIEEEMNERRYRSMLQGFIPDEQGKD